MNYEELARQLLEVTHPKDKRPPLNNMQKQERMQDMTLRFLRENGGSAIPKDLTEFFDVSSARVTKLLGDLEDRGFVIREGDPADRRRVTVRLTPAGETYVLDLDTSFRRRLTNLLELLGERDAREMVRIMTRFVAVMEVQCQEAECCSKGRANGKDTEITERP